MKIGLVYATNSGSTLLVAERVNEIISKKHSVKFLEAKNFDIDSLSNLDLLILGTPTWFVGGVDSSPHEQIIDLLNRMSEKNIYPKKYAAFGCGNKSFTSFCGGVDFIELWMKKGNAKKVIPSLKLDGYYFNVIQSQSETDKWSKELLTVLKNPPK